MGKVRLSKKQAEEIKRIEKMGVWSELSYEDFHSALLSGYEVEPEFKEGDWIYSTDHNKVARVGQNGMDEYTVWTDDEEFGTFSTAFVRHATPEEIAEEKERRWWASHGRKPWEIRDNDVLSFNDLILEVTHAGEEYIAFNNHDIDWMDRERFNSLKHNIRVVCFADDRKDVDNE